MDLESRSLVGARDFMWIVENREARLGRISCAAVRDLDFVLKALEAEFSRCVS